tara:strand:- start:281 stop:481 length:201 start_codon:yes stop_codon:yes gene_type:complete
MNEVYMDGYEHPVAWVQSLNDEKLLKDIAVACVKKEMEEEERRNQIRSGVLPKDPPTNTWNISDRD